MNNDAVTALQIVTLVIAVLGLAVAAVSLTWQIAQHYLSGPRVTVELLGGALGNGAAAIGPLSSVQSQSLASQGFTTPVFAVRARNKGRLPIDVTHVNVEVVGGFALSNPGWDVNPSLPHRLDAGSAIDFYAPADQVFAAREAALSVTTSGQDRVRGKVTLATGGDVHSDWHAVT